MFWHGNTRQKAFNVVDLGAIIWEWEQRQKRYYFIIAAYNILVLRSQNSNYYVSATVSWRMKWMEYITHVGR
jgi:hypothetical protein